MSRVAIGLLLLLAGGCGGSPADAAPLRVFAASSLTEAMASLARGFERERPGVTVVPSFAGSQVLRLQIEEGAPADVFASADRRHMDALVADGLVVEPSVLARNDLVVVTPAGDSSIRTVEDLASAERIVVGEPSVPVGRYTGVFLAQGARVLGLEWRRAVEAHIVSRESNVRGVRARVQMGEADAAIVYRTDVAGVDDLRVIEIPPALQEPAEYWIGVVARSPRRALARRFVAHAMSPTGQMELSRHGFLPPR